MKDGEVDMTTGGMAALMLLKTTERKLPMIGEQGLWIGKVMEFQKEPKKRLSHEVYCRNDEARIYGRVRKIHHLWPNKW